MFTLDMSKPLFLPLPLTISMFAAFSFFVLFGCTRIGGGCGFILVWIVVGRVRCNLSIAAFSLQQVHQKLVHD